MNKDNTIIVTSFSNIACLPVRTLIYVQTLNRFFPKDKIFVIETPPYAKYYENTISRSATLIKTINRVPPFIFHRGTEPRRFGEVIQAWMHIDAENVFITDCDIVVYNDIHDLLEGNFDVAGRIAGAYLFPAINPVKWKEMFIRHNVKQVVPMFNKGFILFKNHTFQKTCKLWYEFMQQNIYNPLYHNYKDQYALSLAIGKMNLKIKKWSDNEVALGWANKYGGALIEGMKAHISKKINKPHKYLKWKDEIVNKNCYVLHCR